jgi:BolA protein
METNRTDALRTALQNKLAPMSIEIIDDSAKHAGHAGAREGGHFRVVVVAEAFKGLSQLQRHRLVYAAVDSLLGQAPPELKIHALNIVARTPDELV